MKPVVQIKPGILIVAALSALFIPAAWLIAWSCAVILHEVSHYLALRAFGLRAFGLRIGAAGIELVTEEGNDLQMSVCALAGPMSGILLLSFFRVVPRVALCGILLAIYNLIPLYPLDGARIVRGAARHFLEARKAEKVITVVEWCAVFILFFGAAYASVFLQLGALPIACALVLFARNKKILANIIDKQYNTFRKTG